MHDLIYEKQGFLEPGILPTWANQVGWILRNSGLLSSTETSQKRIKEDRMSGIQGRQHAEL